MYIILTWVGVYVYIYELYGVKVWGHVLYLIPMGGGGVNIHLFSVPI